jgi:hypothetical protein
LPPRQRRYEGNIPGQTVQFGNGQFSAVQAAHLEGFGELWPVGTLTALNLRELSYQLPIAAVQVLADGSPLSFQARICPAERSKPDNRPQIQYSASFALPKMPRRVKASSLIPSRIVEKLSLPQNRNQ